tara:strand:+ start:795 stop:1451 length:657 start_codon:yes stop_codon:yes gene_type:complete
MKTIFENWNNFLNESGLSRVHQHIRAHDTAVITAFRNDPSSVEGCVDSVPPGEQEESPLKANRARNRNLKAVLLRMGYGVTRVDGSYIENFDDADKRKEVSEESFFVVNLKDDPNFHNNIENLGRKFCQDSVLLIPKGGGDDDRPAFLLGTNESWPGLGLIDPVGRFEGGKEAEFMSRVRGRPFVFKEVHKQETYEQLGRNAKWTVANIAKRVLDESG